jgi:sugar phosphate isomerase/epimerase
MKLTRRDLGKLAAAAIPGTAVFNALQAQTTVAKPELFNALRAQNAAKPNSKVAGVQIGLNVPYNFGGRDMNPDELLDRIVKLNVNAVEMRSQPVETFLGSPGANGAKADADALRQWRATVSMDRVAAFRKKYNDAGVLIEIVKYDGIYNMSDAEVDYCFNLARTLGARAISCEIDAKHTARIGQFANKHKLPVAYHGHATTTPADWEAAFAQAPYNWANLDIGHFVAGNNTSPLPFLKQHHARISHIHVKDRKMKEGPNVPFGEGDTPIVETLRVIRDNKWPIQATIEFEYPVPAGSDRMAELVKTIDYCRKALLS